MLLGILCLATGIGPGALAATAPTPTRPNFVVIVIDDFGWSDLGCYGSSYHQTPNIDRLAARGIRFTNGYAACPVCSPSRAALMTGRHPARLNLTDWLPGRPDRPDQMLKRPEIRQELPLDEITIAEALKPAGYVSASIGKWHLGSEPFWPEHQGFDRNIGGTQSGSPPGGYFNFRTPSLRAADRLEYLTDRLTEEALKFIDEQRDRPFLLYLPHYAVHIPLQASEELRAAFLARPVITGSHWNPIYAAMIKSVDESVGRIVAKLETLGISDRTTIVFTSDNGGLSVREGPNTPATSNTPFRAGKGYLYEGGIRAPWIIAGAGVVGAGRSSDEPVSSVDLFPTLCDLAGVAPPSDRPGDGVSLAPILSDPAGRLNRDALFWHYPHYSNQGGKPGGAIRLGDWKLIEFYEGPRIELYNLKDDPSEEHDQAGKETERAAALRSRLHDWRASVGARMPTPNPDYRAEPPVARRPHIAVRGIYGGYPRQLVEGGRRLEESGVNAIWVGSGGLRGLPIQQLHEQGVRVFAEFNTLHDASYLRDHPDAAPIGGDGQPCPAPEGWQGLCPTHPEYRRSRMEAFRTALADYEIDGIWLDYHHAHASWERADPMLPDTCFCDRCVDQFQKTTGVDLPEETPSLRAQRLLGPLRESWLNWRCGVFTDWVREFKEIRDATRPGALLGTFHCPWSDGDYSNAIREKLAIDLRAQARYIDVFSPMPYHARFGHVTDPGWISRQSAWLGQHLGIKGEAGERLKIWPIVQLSDWGVPVPADQVTAVLDHGTRKPATGVMVFAWGSLASQGEKVDRMRRFYTTIAPNPD